MVDLKRNQNTREFEKRTNQKVMEIFGEVNIFNFNNEI